MLDFVSDLVKQVGENIRRARRARNLSLDDLAHASGVARAGIAKLEAGRGNPTIETLWALATTLGLPFGALIVAPEPSPVVVLHADEGLVVTGSGEHARLLTRLNRGGMSETYDVYYPAGARHESLPHYEGVVEHILVTEGSLLVGPADSPAELGTGDHITFAADVAHLYAPIDGPARVCILMDYPPERHPRASVDGERNGQSDSALPAGSSPTA